MSHSNTESVTVTHEYHNRYPSQFEDPAVVVAERHLAELKRRINNPLDTVSPTLRFFLN